ncbi:MAG: glycine cleavage system protein GcvH [Candidatus Cloacimonetes bacterium]|nr:glycine cleavage system protein GcvH [Candidatus Cloacimonadota bacterium]MDD4155691.1 glycine cleavage system protein GcvH [Candidatus Cloacimonadota bacterium]
MEILDGLRYTESHEWVKLDGEYAYIGITDFAQHELGDIVHVEMPEEGTNINAGEPLGSLEAVKTVEDIYSPITGEVIKINADLFDTPELINNSPYVDGWLIKVRFSDKTEIEKLLTSDEYSKHIG